MSNPTLSVVIPVWASEHSLPHLIPSLREDLKGWLPSPEIIVSAGPGAGEIQKTAKMLNATFVGADGSGYGQILSAGLRASHGRFVVTMDGDFSHRPGYIRSMWSHRDLGEVLISSRYITGSFAEMRFIRRVMSRLLNFLYRKMLALPYRDLSSGFRLYARRVLDDVGPPEGRGLDALLELVVKAYCQGWKIAELPFWYQGARPFTRAKMLRLGLGYLRTLGRLFALRNSVKAADYDNRAFDSWIPLQRYWQRARFRIIHDFASGEGRVLDIGCGSSRIVQTLPQVVATDLAIRKLRWLRAPGRHLVECDMNLLPFADESFDCVVCSEVIEHIPREKVRLTELVRVLRPGGALVLGTPDYGRRLWRTLEWIYGKLFPGGYAKEHINRYTHDELRSILERRGLTVELVRYVARSEMIFKARLPEVIRLPDVSREAVGRSE